MTSSTCTTASISLERVPLALLAFDFFLLLCWRSTCATCTSGGIVLQLVLDCMLLLLLLVLDCMLVLLRLQRSCQ